jgi:hypothetical protein
MKKICPNCRKKYFVKEHSRTDLCQECYAVKRNQDVKNNMKKMRENRKPFYEKFDTQIKPYVKIFLDLDFPVIDATATSIVFSGEIIFDTLPENWNLKFDSDSNITKFYCDAEVVNFVKLGCWIYHNITNKNTKRFN